MTTFCDEIQERIANEGPKGLAVEDFEHLRGCAECKLFAEALKEVDSTLALTVEPSDELVRSVIQQVTADFSTQTERSPRFSRLLQIIKSIKDISRQRFVTAGVATAFVCFVAILGGRSLSSRHSSSARYPASQVYTPNNADSLGNYNDVRYAESANRGLIGSLFGSDELDVEPESMQHKPSVSRQALPEGDKDFQQQPQKGNDFQKQFLDLEGRTAATLQKTMEEPSVDEIDAADVPNHPVPSAPVMRNIQPPVNLLKRGDLYAKAQKEADGRLLEKNEQLLDEQLALGIVAAREQAERSRDKVRANVLDTKRDSRPGFIGGRNSPLEIGSDLDAELAEVGGASDDSNFAGNKVEAKKSKDESAEGMNIGKLREARSISPTDEFLRIRSTTQGLTFQNAYGYWSNNYIPGDREARELEMHLSSFNPSALGFGSQLSSGLQPSLQPFDAPQSSAMAVYLNADRSAVEGESRVLLQVGLKGTSKTSGRRPAMNIGLILDMRGDVSPQEESRLRSVIDQFLKSKEVGDSYSITIAGREGGTIVRGEEFRHGPITLELKEALSKPVSDSGLSLTSALEKSLSDLSLSDDPNSPLGSSAAIIITANSLASELPGLTSLAHRSAVSGIPVSVFAVGDGANAEELNQLALAGQGSRRLVTNSESAVEIVKKELAAVSRIVARAVRLRIKLAPGAKLVSIPGSYQLSDSSADKVREAEQAIDRRLARNLGIESDRGEDEDGIQIVIPAFYADDNHVITLDVVTQGPGPVAEVSLKYKDLVFLKNGSSQANLSLPRGSAAPGALNVNVTKNYLNHGLSDALTQAGEALHIGNYHFAISTLRDQLSLLSGLRTLLPGLDRDSDLEKDIEMLREYLRVLESNVLQSDPAQSRFVASSLRLAGIQNFHPETTNSSIEGE